ncbi:MAG: DNA polymerase III subunit alpha [Spirochaetales bacterium]|nr:DNA polymerase III subunit alpha [Spirochaetales bacterium]
MGNFVHLHNHSDYSLLDGAVKIDWYVKEAQKQGMTHLGLTDHGNLFGALRFEQACHSAGINPVIGMEAYVAAGSRHIKTKNTETKGRMYYHLCLYCKNETGYRNLMVLASRGYTEGFYYKPRIDDELLAQYHEGLIASSACIAGEVPNMIIQGQYERAKERAIFYRDLFGEDNYYLEVMDHNLPDERVANEGLIRLSRELNIPLIATNDIHFYKKEHANAHDIMLCIGTQRKKNETNRMTLSKELYFKTEEEMAALFSHIPEALENTAKLAEKCDLRIPQPGPILPDYYIPEEFPMPMDYLSHLVYEGLEKRYTHVTEEIKERADFELATIEEMGFPGYFLIVWDFIDWAKRNDIPVGPGRGSGAGSIVAYALGITDIDPLLYDLLFERFLNPERVSMPDFDVDFCNERRGEVVDYVTRKYGYDQVGGICTFGTLKTKAVLKDVARVLDIDFNESNAITKVVPDDKPPKDWTKSKVEYYVESVPELKAFYDRGGVYKELFETAAILEGMNRNISTHACGKVIGKSMLTDFVPLYKDQKSGEITSEYTMDIIEPCGLVKMDFLGLKTLDVLKNTENLVRKTIPNFCVDTVSEDDKNTFDMLSRGDSTAIFQFESAGMQKILRDAKPECIEDMIALNALYRPGPMQFIPQYIEGKKNPASIKYPDPDLEELLKPTYGVIVYQEQVMKVAQIIGGFSLGKADILRRAMGKKKVKDMEKMKVEFVAGAKERGKDEKHATYIFEMLEPFAGYGFNKSHAAAYSVVAYKTAYCKANHPAEFMAANLTNEISSPDAFKLYMDTCHDMGLEIMPPDINISEKYFTVNDGKIYYGLVGIKGMGSAAVDNIMRERDANGPFTSFLDFLERMDSGSVNKKVVEVSIQSGLFDKIETHNRATLLLNMERIMEIVSRRKDMVKYGQSSLFGDCDEEINPDIEYEICDPWPKKEMLRIEKENLGFYFSGHPLDDYRKTWKKATTLDMNHLERAMANKEYTVLGMIKDHKVLLSKAGKRMAFGTIEDFNGQIEFALFGRQFEEFGHLLEADAVLGFCGKVDTRRDNPSLRIERLISPEELKEQSVREIHLEMNTDNIEDDDLIDFASFLTANPGNCSVFFHLAHNVEPTIVRASPQFSVSSGSEALERYMGHPLVTSVWKE